MQHLLLDSAVLGLKVAIVSSGHLTRESKEFSAYPSAVIVHELLAESEQYIISFCFVLRSILLFCIQFH